eukprot:COSAG05_NODE_275_length_12406_cov_12.621841_20_plen_208_part_00
MPPARSARCPRLAPASFPPRSRRGSCLVSASCCCLLLSPVAEEGEGEAAAMPPAPSARCPRLALASLSPRSRLAPPRSRLVPASLSPRSRLVPVVVPASGLRAGSRSSSSGPCRGAATCYRLTCRGAESEGRHDSTGLRGLSLGLSLGHHTYRPGHVGTRAPVRLGIRVGVQSNPSLTMSPQAGESGAEAFICLAASATSPECPTLI